MMQTRRSDCWGLSCGGVRRGLWVSVGVLGLLAVVAVAGRAAFEAWPNVAPVAAAALLAGHVVGRRLGRPVLAMAVPVLAMLVSDLLWFGSYEPGVMAAVYGSLAACVVLGRWVGRGNGGARWWAVGGMSLAGSLVFFAVTNAAVWGLTGWYPRTVDGLVACFAAALPFLKYTVLGDLFFAGVLFGVAAAVQSMAGCMARRALAADAGTGGRACPA